MSQRDDEHPEADERERYALLRARKHKVCALCGAGLCRDDSHGRRSPIEADPRFVDWEQA